MTCAPSPSQLSALNSQLPIESPIASATGLVVRYGQHTILDGATVTLQEGERVGLVGRNGAGKTTFLQIAAGVAVPDSGEFVTRRDLIVGYMPQQFALTDDTTVLENILDGARHVLALIDEYENAPPEGGRSAQLLEQIEHLDGWSLDQRAQSLITNLHAPEGERRVDTLSGGERRRVALCRALLARPDFLILDEPTNHLDTESIQWLETFLERYTGSCLFVTHDRYFLDRVASRIIEVAQGRIFSYAGNYTDYLLARAGRQSAEEAGERKRQKYLKRELEWVRSGVQARRTKSQDRMRRYFEDAAQAAPEAELDVELIIPTPPKLANRVLELRDVSGAIGGRELFQNVNLDLAAGERLGVVGRNGLGKSTLLKIMIGELEPSAGEVEIGARTRINYVDQNRLQVDDTKTVWEEVGEGQEYVQMGEESITLRSYLKRFLFTDDRINTRIELLSGGERSRVLLAKILRRGGNVLILDEPTNDLDLGTLRLLEEALVGFAGAVIVVSHDRYFLNRVCTSILAFEGDGVVRKAVGNFDYYLEKRASPEPEPVVAARPAPVPSAKEKPRKLTWKEERELETIEQTILEAEGDVAKLEAMFAAPDFYQKHGDDWQKLQAQLDTGKKRVPQLYARWEELERIKAVP